jgi:hypothetical protein
MFSKVKATKAVPVATLNRSFTKTKAIVEDSWWGKFLPNDYESVDIREKNLYKTENSAALRSTGKTVTFMCVPRIALVPRRGARFRFARTLAFNPIFFVIFSRRSAEGPEPTRLTRFFVCVGRSVGGHTKRTISSSDAPSR